MRVGELPLRPLVAVAPRSSLAEVAGRMRAQDSGAAVVVVGDRLVGIVTERDIVGAIADGLDPREASAAVVMSSHPATVGAGEDLRLVAVRMVSLGVRHLPVVDDEGVPVGLLSARDLIRVLDPELSGSG